MTRVRLTRKLALTMNGVDVSRYSVGDAIELDDYHAQMMIDCDWAERIDGPPSQMAAASGHDLQVASQVASNSPPDSD